MTKKIVRYHVPSTPLPPQPGAQFVKLMNEAEVHRRAAADPDNPPIQPKDFHEYKRVYPFLKRRPKT